MNGDLAVLVLVVLAFAIWVTAHVTTVAGLVARPPRYRSIFAFFVVPLALYWAIRERMFVRAGFWTGGALLYGVARLLAMR